MPTKILTLFICSLLLWSCTDRELPIASIETEVDLRTIKFKHDKFSFALKEAKKMKKPLFLYFTIRDCNWSAKMEDEVFTDPEVQSFINENFVCSKIHLNKSSESLATEEYKAMNASKLKILDSYSIQSSSCPAFAIIDFDGELKRKNGGYMGIQEFLRFGKGE